MLASDWLANFIARHAFWHQLRVAVKNDGPDRPYPVKWESVAHLRVFRASPGEWDKVVTWRADMMKRGWRLLRVSSDAEEIVAVFGKTKLGQHS